MNALDPTDAVSAHLLEIDRLLRRLGHETEIYSEHAHPDLASLRRPAAELRRAHGDLLLFHFAGHTDLLGAIAGFRGLRGVLYHNVTPARFFEGMEESRRFCEKGRRQVGALHEFFHFGVGVSEFNRRELAEAGFRHTTVLPPSREVMGRGASPSPGLLRELGDGRRHVLVVGRLAPHKGIVEAVRAIASLRRGGCRDAHLILAGRTRGYEPYVRKVQEEVRALDLEGAVEIRGEVSSGDLLALYARAQVLLALSEHEGFCVPLVEAMGAGVPVVAHAAAAIPETLQGAGLLVESRELEVVAGALRRILEEPALREELIEKGRRRAEAFSLPSVEEALRALLHWARSLREAPLRGEALPTFSVVVCTCDRARTLRTCLESLRILDYPRFEVVVVNGPSTDDTDEVLARFPDIKRADNPTRNLSVSRNIGIAAAAGEIVAFIDDDAVPDPDWLRRLAEAFADPETGAAGGPVIGPGGDHLQFQNGIISRSGMPRPIQETPPDRNDPHGEWFNILMGTNASFRRSALARVGGFDENFEYYHDESDLCVRVIRAGFSVVHVPNARIWHGFETSRVRKTLRDVDWRVVAKNTIYFYFKNNRWWARPFDFLLPMRAALVLLGTFTRWYAKGEISGRLYLRSLGRWLSGCFLGYGKGIFRPARRRLAARSDPRSETLRVFAPHPVRAGAERLSIALVSQQYPPDPCGGIGVYTARLARGLVEAGHRVSVIARGTRVSVSWLDGVKVHRVPDDPALSRCFPLAYRVVRKNLARSRAVARVVEGLAREDAVRIVESPLWDAEAFATAVKKRVPLVVRLNTPMAIAIETGGWARTADLVLACEIEWEMLRRAAGWIDTSGTIVETFAERGWVRPGEIPVRVIPFGIPLSDCPRTPRAPADAPGRADAPRFLFVGRLEPRKGIDTLLAAIPALLRGHAGATIDIAGNIADGGERIARFYRSCGVDDAHRRVRFLGRVDDAARDRLYAEADVFVAPSRYESFGLVYLEAMARGCAVIAARAGGAPHVVREGVTGLLVPPDDAGALAEAMLLLARETSLRAKMGETAAAHVREEHRIEKMVESTLAFYEEVLRRAPAAPSAASGASTPSASLR